MISTVDQGFSADQLSGQKSTSHKTAGTFVHLSVLGGLFQLLNIILRSINPQNERKGNVARSFFTGQVKKTCGEKKSLWKKVETTEDPRMTGGVAQNVPAEAPATATTKNRHEM